MSPIAAINVAAVVTPTLTGVPDAGRLRTANSHTGVSRRVAWAGWSGWRGGLWAGAVCCVTSGCRRCAAHRVPRGRCALRGVEGSAPRAARLRAAARGLGELEADRLAALRARE